MDYSASRNTNAPHTTKESLNMVHRASKTKKRRRNYCQYIILRYVNLSMTVKNYNKIRHIIVFTTKIWSTGSWIFPTVKNKAYVCRTCAPAKKPTRLTLKSFLHNGTQCRTCCNSLMTTGTPVPPVNSITCHDPLLPATVLR